MGLVNKLKESKNNREFYDWLDNILQGELSDEIKAINFNLYEDENDKWSIEMVGTSEFDENDEDWACYEVFTTRDDPFIIARKSDWETIETFFIGLVKKYPDDGKYAYKLKQYQAVGIGFVDGDLHICWMQ